MSPLQKSPTSPPTQTSNPKDKINHQLACFIRKSLDQGVCLTELPAIANHSKTTKIRSTRNVLLGVIILSAALFVPWFCMDFNDCYLNFPAVLTRAFRPPLSCDFCRGVKEVRRIANVQPDEFEKSFAYNSVPVVVTDATVNWTAMEVGEPYGCIFLLVTTVY